jgi:hypothetical protein
MAVIKFLLNGITLGLHLLDSYTDPPFHAMINLLGGPIRCKVLLPYKEELVSPAYRIFDQLGGLDMFKLLIRPKHIYMVYKGSMETQGLKFLYKDSNGWLKTIQLQVEFEEAPRSVYVIFKHIGIHSQTPGSYLGLVFSDGSPNQELVKKLGKYMKMSISF